MMQDAIAYLDVRAKNCENNAPIQQAEGNAKQARLSRRLAQSYRDAISVLENGKSA